MGEYDVGQVCLNGHPTNGHYRTMPQFNKDFCPDCGEKTITVCPDCNTSIEGQYVSRGIAGFSYHPPAYCKSCGSPFPWASRAIQAAIDLAEVELDGTDREVFEQNVGELTKNSPQTKVAAARIKKIVVRAGGAFGETLRDILVDVASETAKKMLWG